MTETTKERIENARKRLDIAEKWELPTMDQNIFAIVELADEVKKLSDMNASLGSMINNKIVEIKGLKSQLAALKEKCRWRKQSEEPAPEGGAEALIKAGGELVIAHAIVLNDDTAFEKVTGRRIYLEYWRPLDLPETEGQND